MGPDAGRGPVTTGNSSLNPAGYDAGLSRPIVIGPRADTFGLAAPFDGRPMRLIGMRAPGWRRVLPATSDCLQSSRRPG
jgi:hypothetical protein